MIRLKHFNGKSKFLNFRLLLLLFLLLIDEIGARSPKYAYKGSKSDKIHMSSIVIKLSFKHNLQNIVISIF